MQSLRSLIVYGVILFCFDIVLIALTWPYALDTAEVDKQYPVACGIILIIVCIGQLISIIVITLFEDCIKEIEDCCFWILAIIIYPIIWFSCGAGQLIIVVLMIINAETNSDGGVKAYGAIITALTMIYMFASSVYHTIVFIWFYHKSQQVENE